MFTWSPGTDGSVVGVFSSSGKAILTTDQTYSVTSVFSFPPAKVTVENLIAVSEKVFVPAVLQLRAGEQVFITLENQSPFMLIFDELSVSAPTA